MNTLQYLKLPIALVLTVKLWLNQELKLGLQTTSLMPRTLGHLTKPLLWWRYFQQYKSPFYPQVDRCRTALRGGEGNLSNLLQQFPWMAITAIYSRAPLYGHQLSTDTSLLRRGKVQEGKFTSSLLCSSLGEWFSRLLNPVHLRKFPESVDRFQNVFTGIALAT